MIPFSTERLSFGSPAIDHILIVTSSPKTALMDIFMVCLSFSRLRFYLHSSSSSFRYKEVNGPAYETIPAAIRQSPINKDCFSPRILTVSVHLTFSPSRPPIIFSARINFFPQSSISADNSFSYFIKASIYF